MFHYFEKDISDIKLPLKFTYPFCYEPHPLAVMASEQVQAYLRLREDWADEIGHGKMFGQVILHTATSTNILFLRFMISSALTVTSQMRKRIYLK